MKKIRFLVLIICLMFCVGYLYSDLSYDRTESQKLESMFNKVKGGIVYCYSENSKTTGFFVSRDGWILTAGHKVDRDFPAAHPIHIKLTREKSGEVFQSTKIIVPVRDWDLLLFKIDYKPKFYFKKFNQPILFEENWVFGFRAGSGKVPSSSGYITFNMVHPNLLLTTAPTTRGNSGSPVLNRYGNVLGIVTKGYDFGDSLFISSNIIKEFIKKNLK